MRLPTPRDEPAAKQLLTQAIRRHGGAPEQMPIDGSLAKEAAITSDHEEHGTAIEIRPSNDLHTVVDQDHRAVKRVTRPMLSVKSFDAAHST